MSAIPIHARLSIRSGTVFSIVQDVDLPQRRGVGSIGKRGRARLRSSILRQFVAEIGATPADVVSGTMEILDRGRACSLGYGQLLGQDGPVPLVRLAA